MEKEWTNEEVLKECSKYGVYKGSSSLGLIKEEVIQDVKVIGKWKDYRKFWADKSYTIEESEASEVLRVKFYRAKEIYKKLENNFVGNKECDDCIYNFIEGYCLGVRADKDTRDMLLWLIRKNYFKEI